MLIFLYYDRVETVANYGITVSSVSHSVVRIPPTIARRYTQYPQFYEKPDPTNSNSVFRPVFSPPRARQFLRMSLDFVFRLLAEGIHTKKSVPSQGTIR